MKALQRGARFPGSGGGGLCIGVMLSLSLGCRPAEPEALCTMTNPEAGRSVSLYREIWYKRPRGYDEKRHIEHWKVEQRKAGFTIEVQP